MEREGLELVGFVRIRTEAHKRPMAVVVSKLARTGRVQRMRVEWASSWWISSRCFERSRKRHKEDAYSEFQYYRKLTRECRAEPNGDTTHIVFNFAEFYQIQSFVKKPWYSHFATGISFLLFGVSCSNILTNHVLDLPEGHSHNGKTADKLLSMVYLIFQIRKNVPREL